MNIFDILGPVMVGPSSSHTAGACRMGRISRALLGAVPARAEITLHGSFASTGEGHGTDQAIVGGLLGMKPDDRRIPMSFDVAKDEGLEFVIIRKDIKGAHPNTALLKLEAADGRKVSVQASSIGGGRIRVDVLDGIAVSFSGESNTFIAYHEDKPGMVSDITALIAMNRINIATLQLFRNKRNGQAVAVIEVDSEVPKDVISVASRLDGIHKVIYFNSRED